MPESIRKLVQVVSKVGAPTTPCFEVFNRSHNTEPQNVGLVARLGSVKVREFTKCRGKSQSCCNSGRDVPGTYMQDPYRFVSSISWSRCGSSYCNRLHRDQRFFFDLRNSPRPTSAARADVGSSAKVRKSALHMLSWEDQTNSREQLELKAHSGYIEDWKAYIMWEKQGKKVQYGPGPVLLRMDRRRKAVGRC